jgi:Cysteine rich repeat
MTKLLAATAAMTLLFAVQIQDHAQAQERQQGQDACGRDSSRLCKAVINDGDQAVLACLKQNRAKLRAVCVKFLQEKGQL